MQTIKITALALAMTACGGQNGATEEASDTSIVGGTVVAPGDVLTKHTVALVMPDGDQFCTGTLISAKLVVTAAHCLDGYDDDSLYVAFGPTARPGSFARERLRAATKAVMHEKYDTDAMEEESATRPPNDIALLTLNEPAPSAYAPAPVMAANASLQIGETLTLAGFGLTHWLTGSSGVLRKVDTRLVKTSGAAKEFEFGQTPGRSACMGDSGGPAFVKRGGKYVLVGVTSRGSGTCSAGGIYTDIRYFRSWIDETAAR